MLLLAKPVGAQTPPRPYFPPPPPQTNAVGRSLTNAYNSIVRAGANNPAAAQQASYKYAQALQRAQAGDVSGALAASSQAQAQALMGATQPLPLNVVQPAQQPATVQAPTGVTPPTNGVPIVDSGGEILSADLLIARNEIDLAGQVSHKSLDGAKAHYRRALDAYQSGNADRSRAEARAAFDAAASILSTVK